MVGQLRISTRGPFVHRSNTGCFFTWERLAGRGHLIYWMPIYFSWKFLGALPKAKYTRPEGTYLAWIDLRAYGYPPEELKRILTVDAKVLVEEGTIFGEEGAGFIRVNVACPRDILKEGLERMANVLK